MEFCDSCLDAALDEGGSDIPDFVLGEFGADIADHLCDENEGGATGDPCNCACH